MTEAKTEAKTAAKSKAKSEKPKATLDDLQRQLDDMKKLMRRNGWSC